MILLPFLLALHAAPLHLEAETGTLSGKALVQSAGTGYAGTGYVGGFEAAGDLVTFSVNIPTTAVYQVNVGFRTPSGQKGIDVLLDGAQVGSQLVSSATWTSATFAQTKFTQGTHQLAVGNGWGWFQIDWVELVPIVATAPERPTDALIDPRADLGARRLHGWLLDQYGKQVVTGQTDSSNAKWVFQQTGKLPAIVAFEMMDHTPSRHLLGGGNPAEPVEMAVRWGQNGGIVAYQWHWVPPSGVNPGNDKNGNPSWWGGFYTDHGTFDLEKALSDTTNSDYKGLMRDIDSISGKLAKLRDAGIPVLWRPLHESEGGWFWWGAKGPSPLKKLWSILYHRMTEKNQLHNLIWVFTSATDSAAKSWYPGDSLVDIVGLDAYSDSANGLSLEWKALNRLVNGHKLVALSECGHGDGTAPGVLPTPENVNLYQTWWSYEVPWGGDHITRWPGARLGQIYRSEMMVTQDELPLWSSLSSLKSKPVATTSSLTGIVYGIDGRATTRTSRLGLVFELTPLGIRKRVLMPR